MAATARNIACFALLVSIMALQVPSCIDQRGTTSAGTTTTASPSAPPPLFDDSALKAAILALAGMDAVLIAAAVIYTLQPPHAPRRRRRRRVSELAFFVLCLQVGVLQFVLFVQQPAAAADHAARALGTSAARALPCVASVTFFLGITLVYAHVGNGGGGAVAGNGPVPAPATATIRLLADMTLGAASACLMSIILALLYINTK
ncbi:unnamed protein product [Miscanthus lutarioriparius]|uniref:Uncharacterized protein n=1 Tax=Miscanthus lutarioriparius TaxID=422564 RepID=A0A811SBA3_9POAL|nr:unnamed protein product [Miscanthus lutarioriparius]